MITTIEERLNEQIYELETANRELESKLEDLSFQTDWYWRHIRQLDEEENLDLPLPRLEIRYTLDDYNAYAGYGLVTRHYTGHIDYTPLSSTRVSKSYAEDLTLPHRDGAHIIHDKEKLNIPAYIVFENKFKEILFNNVGERSSNF